MSLLALLGVMNQEPGSNYPVPSTPTVASTGGGTCSGSSVATPASIRVSWTITNPDGTNYTAKLYENNVLKSTAPTAASMHFDKTISAAVEDGSQMPWKANWTYRVDIIENLSGAVVATKSSAEWTQAYGGCGGPI